DEQVDEASGRIGEVPEHAACPEDLDRVDEGPRGPGRDRREGAVGSLEERSREEPLAGEEHHPADEQQDRRHLQRTRDRTPSYKRSASPHRELLPGRDGSETIC